MAMTDAQELLKHDLGDILYAEKQILKALKPMIREASDPEMRARLEQHQGETEQQITNLERAFEAMGLKARGQKCPGILGIIEEKKEFQEEEEPSKAVLEAFNLGAGLRVEHYEIAAYRSAMAVAKASGQTQVVALLRENLEQELAMAKFIEGASAKVLRAAMAMMASEEMGEGGGRGGRKSAGGARGGAKSGGAKSGAAKSGGAKSGGSRSGGRSGTSAGRSSAGSTGRSTSGRSMGGGAGGSTGGGTSSGGASTLGGACPGVGPRRAGPAPGGPAPLVVRAFRSGARRRSLQHLNRRRR